MFMERPVATAYNKTPEGDMREPNRQQPVLTTLLMDRDRLFPVAEVARMLGLSEEAVTGGGERVTRMLSWKDVVVLGLVHRWTIRAVARAFPTDVIPKALATERREIALPAYQWAVLAHHARLRLAGGMDAEYDVSDAVEEAVFHHLVATVDDWDAVERTCPTAERAAMWPEGR
jgi:hypothetical protein